MKTNDTSEEMNALHLLFDKIDSSDVGGDDGAEWGDWFLSKLDPVYLKKELEEWEKLQTKLKEAKEALNQEGYRLSHECVIAAEESKKNNMPLSSELKSLIERYKIKDKQYNELLIKYNTYHGIGRLPHVKVSNLEAEKLWVLRCVCPDCNRTEGLSLIIDRRDIN